MILPVVLATAAVAGAPPAAVSFDRVAATPGEDVTVRLQRLARPVRVYLLEQGETRPRSATDRRLHYAGFARPKGGKATIAFEVPPIDGVYVAWCVGCRPSGSLRVTLPAVTSTSCPATIARSRPPPGLSGVWHGNDALWTSLPEGGVRRLTGGWGDGLLGDKLFWFARFDGVLTLAGRRLDSRSPQLKVLKVNRGRHSQFRGPSWATPVSYPTAGCWLLTARLESETFAITLSYAVRVVGQ